MVVATEGGQWVVPPTRAIWVLSGVLHEIRCVGEVQVAGLVFLVVGIREIDR